MLVGLLIGCGSDSSLGDPEDPEDSEGTRAPDDADGDGFADDFDCADDDAARNPGAEEICSDGLDNDCDGGPGDCRVEAALGVEDAWTTLEGFQTRDEFGHAVLTGDLDGDGQGDLVVASPAEAWGVDYEGVVRVVHGPIDAGDGLNSKNLILRQDGPAGLGTSMALGDVDGDGSLDLLLGAPRVNGPAAEAERAEAGALYVLLGPHDATGATESPIEVAVSQLLGSAAYEALGSGVGAGDLDGDGRADIVVGAQAWINTDDEPRAALFPVLAPVPSTWDSDSADTIWVSTAAGTEDVRVLLLTDLNGDGLADSLVAVSPTVEAGEASANRIYALTDPVQSGLHEVGDLATASWCAADDDAVGLGASVAVGDLDLDGAPDLLVGAPLASWDGVDTGAAFVFTAPHVGEALTSTAIGRVVGESSGSEAGSHVSLADLDGDGEQDVVLSAPLQQSSGGAAGAGRIYGFYGAVEGLVSVRGAGITWSGTADGTALGNGMSLGEDLTGDSSIDLIASALGVPSGDLTRSSLCLFAGSGI